MNIGKRRPRTLLVYWLRNICLSQNCSFVQSTSPVSNAPVESTETLASRNASRKSVAGMVFQEYLAMELKLSVALQF